MAVAAKTIVIVGTLDTKGAEYAFLKAEIEKRGSAVLVVDAGVLGAPAFAPDVPHERVAESAGSSIAALVAAGDRAEAVAAMARGAAVLAAELYAAGRLDGIVSLGGSGGTLIGASAMCALPLGVPKLMVSTAAFSDPSMYVGHSDIVLMPAIVDIAGLNNISRALLAQAAGAICGMVLGESPVPDQRPALAASMIGNTTLAVDQARHLLEARGYAVQVYHANGGGCLMEDAIAQGQVVGVLDLTLTELSNELCGGVRSAGPNRLKAAGVHSIPQVVAPGGLDLCNFWAPETVPTRYRSRKLHAWSPKVTLMRTDPDENARLGELIAAKLNAAKGPVRVLIPRRGFSALSAEGGPFWWPEADASFANSLKTHLRPDIWISELACHINDAAFAAHAAEELAALVSDRSAVG